MAAENLEEIICSFTKKTVFVIDMPIGLSSSSHRRECDILARDYIAERRSSIFYPPCNQAFQSLDYNSANALNKKITGKGLSKQSWFLFDKMREAEFQALAKKSIFEGHPECSFTKINGSPMKQNKSSLKGLFTRIKCLASIGFKIESLSDFLPEYINAAPDDLVDAAILCWSASRISSQQAFSFPKTPVKNSKGLTLAIFV